VNNPNRIKLFFFVHCVHVNINEGSFVYQEGNILQRILFSFGLNRTFLKTHQLLKIRIYRWRTVDAIDQMVAARRNACAKNRSKQGICVKTRARSEKLGESFTSA
jgi:hypothetical protein